jgi:hypothetical protein
MAVSTPWEVYTTLRDLSYLVLCVDNINDCIYFETVVYEPGVRSILTPLGWQSTTIRYITGTLEDPYPQYLDITRHDSLLRHELGVIVPHDTLSGISDTSLVSPVDGDFIVYSDGVYTNRTGISGGTP